jgi:hypothetical protein
MRVVVKPAYTDVPPTLPGLYWFRVGPSLVDRHCRVWEQDGLLVTTTDGQAKDVRLFARRWAGPLLEPSSDER